MLTTKLKASYILIIFVITLPTLTNILFSIYKFKILNKHLDSNKYKIKSSTSDLISTRIKRCITLTKFELLLLLLLFWNKSGVWQSS